MKKIAGKFIVTDDKGDALFEAELACHLCGRSIKAIDENKIDEHYYCVFCFNAFKNKDERYINYHIKEQELALMKHINYCEKVLGFTPEGFKNVKRLKCLRCDYEWIPRSKNPVVCPKCGSKKWDSKRKGNEPGRVPGKKYLNY